MTDKESAIQTLKDCLRHFDNAVRRAEKATNIEGLEDLTPIQFALAVNRAVTELNQSVEFLHCNLNIILPSAQSAAIFYLATEFNKQK